MTAKHHQLGASTCERWGACPGSVVLSKNAPALPASKYAAQGTAAHTACATWLEQGSPFKFGVEIEADGFKFTYSDDDYDTTVCHEYVQQYVTYIETRIAANNLSKHKVLIEQRVNIPDTDLFGTADCILIDPYNFMEVIDFKYGKGVLVPAKGNKQLLYYALAAYLTLPEVVRQEIPKIRRTIVQPRAAGGGIDSEECTPNELMEFHGWLMASKETVEIALEHYELATGPYKTEGELEGWQNIYLHPGDHCRWCPANPLRCPAVQDYSITTISNGDAKADFANLTQTELKLPAPNTLPIETLINIFNNGNVIKDYIDKCHSVLNILAKENAFNPADYRLKLVEGVKHRKWADEKQAQIELMNMGFELKDIQTEPKLKSPNGIKDTIGGKEGKEFYERYSYKPEGEISLAPINDRRPAVTYSKAAEDFKDIALEYRLTKSVEVEIIE